MALPGIGRPAKAKRLAAKAKEKAAKEREAKRNTPLGKALSNPDGAFSSGTMKDKIERRLAKERAKGK